MSNCTSDNICCLSRKVSTFDFVVNSHLLKGIQYNGYDQIRSFHETMAKNKRRVLYFFFRFIDVIADRMKNIISFIAT